MGKYLILQVLEAAEIDVNVTGVGGADVDSGVCGVDAVVGTDVDAGVGGFDVDTGIGGFYIDAGVGVDAEVGVGAKPKFVVRQKDIPGNTNAVTAGIVEE